MLYGEVVSVSHLFNVQYTPLRYRHMSAPLIGDKDMPAFSPMLKKNC